MRTVVAVFPSREEAEHVAKHLKAIGIPTDDVSIASADRHDRTEGEWSRRNIAASAASGWGWFLAGLIPLIAERTKTAASLVGAALGGGAGLIIGLIAAVARGLPITGGTSIGTTLLAMIFLAVFAGFAAETYASGVSHESEALYEEAVREHGVVLAVHVEQAKEPEAARLMNEHGARLEHAGADAWLASGWKGRYSNDEPYPSDSTFVSHPIGR